MEDGYISPIRTRYLTHCPMCGYELVTGTTPGDLLGQISLCPNKYCIADQVDPRVDIYGCTVCGRETEIFSDTDNLPYCQFHLPEIMAGIAKNEQKKAEAKWLSLKDGEVLHLTYPDTPPFISFHDKDGAVVGQLEMNKEGMTFTGNTDEAARAFFDYLKVLVDGYINKEDQ